MSKRTRMSGVERREQLIQVAKQVFATRGFDGASMEEIANKAKVSKPIVYEHFGGKEGIYAVVVDREVQQLVSTITQALTDSETPREMTEGAALALLNFIDTNADGFRILVRDSPVAQSTGSYSSVIGDVAQKVEHILAAHFKEKGFETKWAPMYAQMLVGMVSQVGQWWQEEHQPDKHEVASHLVNLAWFGLSQLQHQPSLKTRWADQFQNKS